MPLKIVGKTTKNTSKAKLAFKVLDFLSEYGTQNHHHTVPQLTGPSVYAVCSHSKLVKYQRFVSDLGV